MKGRNVFNNIKLLKNSKKNIEFFYVSLLYLTSCARTAFPVKKIINVEFLLDVTQWMLYIELPRTRRDLARDTLV